METDGRYLVKDRVLVNHAEDVDGYHNDSRLNTRFKRLVIKLGISMNDSNVNMIFEHCIAKQLEKQQNGLDIDQYLPNQ